MEISEDRTMVVSRIYYIDPKMKFLYTLCHLQYSLYYAHIPLLEKCYDSNKRPGIY